MSDPTTLAEHASREFTYPSIASGEGNGLSWWLDSARFLWIAQDGELPWSPAKSVCLGAIHYRHPWVDTRYLVLLLDEERNVVSLAGAKLTAFIKDRHSQSPYLYPHPDFDRV